LVKHIAPSNGPQQETTSKPHLKAYNRLQLEVFDQLNTYSPSEIRDICTDNKSSKYKIISDYLAQIHFCVELNTKMDPNLLQSKDPL
jgi:hypothetical protein